MKKIRAFAVAALITVSAVSSSYAIVGLGLHWGFDLSLSMDDVRNERMNIPGLDVPGLLDAAGLGAVAGAAGDIDVFRVSRVNFDRTAINFGGKAYIDFLPFIEAVELSCNFGLWQYEGSLDYLSLSANADGSVNYGYRTIALGLRDYNELSYLGLRETPYAKLHFDLTVRKTLLNLWLVKLSGGLGMSAHFSTPLLSGRLIEDAIGSVDYQALFNTQLDNSSVQRAVGKAIVEQILDEALGNPLFGAHLLVGARVKLPVIPIGFYLDGKFMIPIGRYDSDVSKDSGIKGYGFLVNTGISLSI